jgi:hypothetical protein
MASDAARQSSSCMAFRKQHAAPYCFALAIAVVLGGEAAAQVFDRSIALPPAEVDELSAASAAHLENAGRFLAEEQWAEAVESLRRVQEADPARLVRADLAQPRAGFERYIPANQYCQQRLTALANDAPPALAHYRGLVDPLAETWFQQGSQADDEALL